MEQARRKIAEIEMESVHHELVSPRQLSKQSGWPERRIRSLIALNQIRHVRIGSSILVPAGAIDEFLKANMVVPTQVQQKVTQNG